MTCHPLVNHSCPVMSVPCIFFSIKMIACCHLHLHFLSIKDTISCCYCHSQTPSSFTLSLSPLAYVQPRNLSTIGASTCGIPNLIQNEKRTEIEIGDGEKISQKRELSSHRTKDDGNIALLYSDLQKNQNDFLGPFSLRMFFASTTFQSPWDNWD